MDQTEQDIFDKVATILEEVAGTDRAAISPEKGLIDDLDVDSLALIEVAVAIQDEFDFEVPDQRVKDLKTVADVVQLVREAKVTA